MTGAGGGLAFWLRYVQAQGGLTEDRGDSTLVVLPPRLQTLLDLPDELMVTGDPDVAREDGATLLAAGHPVLGQAADDVLAEGDVGQVAIPVPATLPPAASVLLERAREQFSVHHGRIDATGAPTRTVRPVLRVGALVSYAISTEDHYQERMECFLDAPSRLELDDCASARLTTLPRTAGSGPVDLGEVTAAIGQAHHIIDARAEKRRASLSGQATKAFEVELQRAEDYYRDMLATIERRRANAPAERRELLAARAQAVREERGRRLAEVRAKFQPAHEIRPYRLQVFELAAWRLPVDVRRGDRRYPLTLDWLVSLSRFADLRCPHCQDVQPLVAGKARLGCTGCLVTASVHAVLDQRPTARPVSAREPATAGGPATAGEPATTAKPVTPGGGRAKLAEPKAGRPAAATPPAPATQPLPPAKIANLGDRLSAKVWEAVAAGDRRSSRICSPDSPAAAAARLYGPDWAAVAIGIPLGELPMAHASGTTPAKSEALQATRGVVQTAVGRRFPFLLWWRPAGGAALLEEVLPFDAALNPARLPRWVLGPGRPGITAPPRPLLQLEPVGRQLWRHGLPHRGLPIVLRCLAAWWRLPDQPALVASHQPAALAAGLERLICYRAAQPGARYADAASAYRVDESTVRTAGADLQAQLQLSPTTLW